MRQGVWRCLAVVVCVVCVEGCTTTAKKPTAKKKKPVPTLVFDDGGVPELSPDGLERNEPLVYDGLDEGFDLLAEPGEPGYVPDRAYFPPHHYDDYGGLGSAGEDELD